MNTYTNGRGRWPLLRLTAVGGAMVIALAACDVDQLLEIDDPEFPGAGEAPISAVAGGATVELQRAYSGAAAFLHNEGYASISAALADEFIAAGTFPTRIAIDSRHLQTPSDGNTSDAAYRYLHRARRAALDANRELAADDVTSGAVPARLHAFEGFPYVALGEGFCGAVPISDVEDGVFVHGPMLTTTGLFEAAVERFDRGLTAQGGHHLSAVGKGRALLNLGRFAEAAAAVSGVPTSFIYFFEHSDNDGWQRNNIWALMNNGRWSMSDNEGGNGLPYLSSGDPRVPWILDGAGFDGSTPKYVSQRYAHSTATSVNNAANFVLADGVEARLIEAEAALHAGGDWLGILNTLRANYASLMAARYGGDMYLANLAAGVEAGRLEADLPPLTDPGTAAARVDLLFQERGFWLYLTGHRLGDMRRLARAPYNRPVNSIFPIGDYHKDGQYGNDVNFSIPFDEENNINYDPSACVTTQP